MNISEFQAWLNSKGADIVIDGKAGPDTRSAILQVFKCTDAVAVSEPIKAFIAAGLGGSLKQINAVAKVESSGGGWDDDGMVKILWERHYFWKRVQIIIPWISNPKGGDYTLDTNRNGTNDSWEKLCLAACRNPIAAFESASWGKFQIMGAHAKSLGYANALEFAWELSRYEASHYKALAAFIRVNGLMSAFRALSTDWRTCTAFARGFNGKGQKGYDIRLARAMA
jgi:N-acetylmuramidase